MVFETFVALVAFLALIYAGIARYIQNKLIDKKEMEAIQAESKQLNADFKKAQERKDQKAMDEALKKQMEFLPKMNKMMFAQFKPMFVILGIFFLFTLAVNYVDPSGKDDITLKMADNGSGCDLKAGDGIYSACYTPANANQGKWIYTAKAMAGGGETGRNSTYFFYGSAETGETFADAAKGAPLAVSTDKRAYGSGDAVKLFAQPSGKADDVEAMLNNGTAFYVDLPFTIPLINVKRIEQAYWWFIFVSLIANLSLSLVLGQYEKMKKAGGKK